MAINLYQYVPNAGAAVLFVVLFIGTTCLHIFSMLRTRSWFYTPLVIGALLEALGYCFRIYSHFNVTSVTGYAGQSVLILISPPLIAATIYMILGRIIRALDCESLSVIRSRWLTRIFVTGDVFCFLLQSTGGGLQVQAGNDVSKFDLGKNIIVGGLVLQVVLFTVFVAIATIFHIRLHAIACNVQHPWRPQMMALFVASAFILARNVVRIVEYAQGFDGYIMTHEVYIYVFDAMLMLGVLALLWAIHAGRFLHAVARPQTAGFVLESAESGFATHLGKSSKAGIACNRD